MPELEWLNSNTNTVIYVLKAFFISIFTYYISIKLLDMKQYLTPKYKFLFFLSAVFIAVSSLIVEGTIAVDINSMFLVMVLVAIFFKIITKNSLGYSILISVIALSISQILFLFSIVVGFIPQLLIKIHSEYLNFLIIILINLIIIKLIFKIKKIRNGVAVLKRNKGNQYFNMIILNVSWMVLFLTIIVVYCRREIANQFVMVLIIFSIIMFITIQKSLQLYYKQKMLIKDLEETKAELESKRKEVEELEKENLNFSKVSHSIAHKQKSLEFKLNELSMNSEISSEISLKDRVDKLGKELAKETISVIDKTGIEEIDDMLKYMQAECIKNKIDFQLQLSGNIYTMINHYIDKEELEILLADHIKNAIIAISYTDNLNKSILVRLGKLDGYYGLYIYDSGIEFEVKNFI